MYRADRGQKESDTLKLELQTAVSHYVGGGIEPGNFARAASALKSWALSPAPVIAL